MFIHYFIIISIYYILKNIFTNNLYITLYKKSLKNIFKNKVYRFLIIQVQKNTLFLINDINIAINICFLKGLQYFLIDLINQ